MFPNVLSFIHFYSFSFFLSFFLFRITVSETHEFSCRVAHFGNLVTTRQLFADSLRHNHFRSQEGTIRGTCEKKMNTASFDVKKNISLTNNFNLNIGENAKQSCQRFHLHKKLLVAPGITTRNKKLVARCIATRNKCIATSPCIVPNS